MANKKIRVNNDRTELAFRRRAREKGELRNRSREQLRSILTLGLSLIAAVASLFFVSVWIYESPDRQLDREVRRTNLVSAARQLLNPTGEVIEPTYSVQWAIQTLSNLNEPIDIEAPSVNLSTLYLPCGKYRIQADELDLYFTSIDRASITVWSDNVSFSAVARNSEIAFRNKPLSIERGYASIQVIGSRILNSHITFENSAELSLTALYSSQVSSWLGKIDFDNFQVRNMISFPSPTGLYDIPEHASSLFDLADLETSAAKIKTRPGTRLKVDYDIWDEEDTALNFAMDQNHGLVDLTEVPPRISKLFLEHCSSVDGKYSCYRPEPTVFVDPKQNLHSPIPCSRRNSNFSFNPLKRVSFPSE